MNRTIAWNNVEKARDCPCRGPRYGAGGKAVVSPTVRGAGKEESIRR